MPEKKKITKRVISRVAAPKVEKTEEKIEAAPETEVKPKKSCLFCKSKTSPSYTDLATLKKYLTDRAKIVTKLRSGVCSKHQRAVGKQIKYARHLSLLPFTPKV